MEKVLSHAIPFPPFHNNFDAPILCILAVVVVDISQTAQRWCCRGHFKLSSEVELLLLILIIIRRISGDFVYRVPFELVLAGKTGLFWEPSFSQPNNNIGVLINQQQQGRNECTFSDQQCSLATNSLERMSRQTYWKLSSVLWRSFNLIESSRSRFPSRYILIVSFCERCVHFSRESQHEFWFVRKQQNHHLHRWSMWSMSDDGSNKEQDL